MKKLLAFSALLGLAVPTAAHAITLSNGATVDFSGVTSDIGSVGGALIAVAVAIVGAMIIYRFVRKAA